MQVENVDRFWDPQGNRGMKGPKGTRVAGKGAHAFLWGSVVLAYMYFSSYKSETNKTAYRPPPPPCEAPAPFREVLSTETTYEQPHLRSLEVERTLPDHIPQVKLPLRDHTVYVKTDARK